jgi:LPXTG-motif cell wall-anchored protein
MLFIIICLGIILAKVDVSAEENISSITVRTNVGITFKDNEETSQDENDEEECSINKDDGKILPKTGDAISSRISLFGILLLIICTIFMGIKRKKVKHTMLL